MKKKKKTEGAQAPFPAPDEPYFAAVSEEDAKKSENIAQFGSQSILKLLIKFSIPGIVGMVVNAIYNIIDRVFLMNVDTAYGAALTYAFPIMMITFGIMVLFGMGGSVLFSISLGQKNNTRAGKALGNALFCLITVFALLTVVGVIFAEDIIRIFVEDDDVLGFAAQYLRIISIGMIAQGIGIWGNNFIRADGSPKTSMVSMFIGAGINIVLDAIFIMGFHWDIAGAAWGTIIGQGCSAIWVIAYFISKRANIRLRLSMLKPDLKIIARIVMVGIPAFILQAASALVQLLLNSVVGRYALIEAEKLYTDPDMIKAYTTAALAAIGVANSFQTLFLMPITGVNQGANPIIGYNYGAKKYVRARKTLGLGIAIASVFALIGFLLAEIFPVQILNIFSSDELLIELGIQMLRRWFMASLLSGFIIMGSNYFMSIGKTGRATLLTSCRQIFFIIPLIILLPMWGGLPMLYYASPLADLLMTVVVALFLLRELTRQKKNERAQPLSEQQQEQAL